MGWKIVEVNSDDYMRLYLNNIMIERPNGNISININDIDTLILDNNKTTMSVRLMNALSYQNVNTVIFNNVHEPGSYLLPVVGNHNSLKIVQKQAKWSKKYKGLIWEKLIKNKLDSQIKLLKLIGLTTRIKELEAMAKDVEHYDITNREGHAAKVYWHTLFHKSFIRDHSAKQFPLINIMLNYGYTVLRGMAIRSIVKKGLDPRFAIFHKSFSNYFALASDVMEPFRPIVDKVVYENTNIFMFDLKTRQSIIKSLNKKVTIDGKKYYLTNAIDMCIDSIINDKGWKWVDIWD